jgi:hypothetical protein
MKAELIEVEICTLPRVIKLKGEKGKHVLFILKAASRKLGAQLIKLEPGMLQLLEQH